jgi:hypothetical protein
MSQADLIMDMPPIRSELTISSSVVVLIAVPEIKRRPSKASQRMAQPHMRIAERTARPGRRRLRREVRFAGCALLALVPIASACTLGWSSRPDRIVACSISDPLQSNADSDGFADSSRLGALHPSTQPTIVSPQAVALSIERAVAAPGPVSEAPVIFPGFVLPDDSREDSVHEGS